MKIDKTKPRFWFELYQDTKGEWRWRLRAINGRIIADSAEGFNSRGGAIDSIQLVMMAVGSEKTITTDDPNNIEPNQNFIPAPSFKSERADFDTEGQNPTDHERGS